MKIVEAGDGSRAVTQFDFSLMVVRSGDSIGGRCVVVKEKQDVLSFVKPGRQQE